MELSFVMESLDGLSDDVKKLYTEDTETGKFKLTGIKGARSQEDVDNALRAKGHSNKENSELKEKLKPFEALRKSPLNCPT